jgi:hypothetical protein
MYLGIMPESRMKLKMEAQAGVSSCDERTAQVPKNLQVGEDVPAKNCLKKLKNAYKMLS